MKSERNCEALMDYIPAAIVVIAGSALGLVVLASLLN